jgi:hypothetical protein
MQDEETLDKTEQNKQEHDLDDGERRAASVDESTLVDAAAAYGCRLALRSSADTDGLQSASQLGSETR